MVERDENGEIVSLSYSNPYKQISINDINTLRDTHILDVSSVLDHMLAVCFNLYPYSILGIRQQKEINIGTWVNPVVLAASLVNKPIGSYIKVHAFNRAGTSFRGHSCVIKKTGDSEFSFFDPDEGESQHLSAENLVEKVSAVMWAFQANKLVLQDGDLYCKAVKRAKHASEQAKAMVSRERLVEVTKDEKNVGYTRFKIIVLHALKNLTRSSDYRIKELVTSYMDYEIEYDDPTLNPILKGVLEALNSKDVNTLSSSNLAATISGLEEWLKSEGDPDIEYNALLASLRILQKYLVYNESKNSEKYAEAVGDFKDTLEKYTGSIHGRCACYPYIFLPGAILQDLNFEKSMSWIGANLANAKFVNVDLNGGEIYKANFKNTQFIKCSMNNLCLESEDNSMNEARFDACSLYGMELLCSRLPYQELVSLVSESDLFPGDWCNNENLKKYLEKYREISKRNSVFPDRMIIAKYIVKNISVADMDTERKIKLLKVALNHKYFMDTNTKKLSGDMNPRMIGVRAFIKEAIRKIQSEVPVKDNSVAAIMNPTQDEVGNVTESAVQGDNKDEINAAMKKVNVRVADVLHELDMQIMLLKKADKYPLTRTNVEKVYALEQLRKDIQEKSQEYKLTQIIQAWEKKHKKIIDQHANRVKGKNSKTSMRIFVENFVDNIRAHYVNNGVENDDVTLKMKASASRSKRFFQGQNNAEGQEKTSTSLLGLKKK